MIKRFVEMGADNRVFENVVMGGEPQDLKYDGASSKVVIGDANIFREGVTVHRSAHGGGATRIGSRNYLMVYSHVAHDCVIEDDVILANNVLLAGHVVIEHHAFMAGGSGVHQFCQVGRHSMVGGNAKVEQDVPPFMLVDGVPARARGLNHVGLRRRGFSQEDISALKRAYRILFGPGLLEDRLNRIQEIDSVHARYLVEFIRRSERGFCRSEP